MSDAVAKDLTAGTFAGVAQLLVGHPFDTIKVKLQSQPAPLPGQQPRYSGAVDAVKQTLAAEGPKGLYKGMGAPLATVAVFNAVLFTARGQMEALLRDSPGAHLTVNQQMIAGMLILCSAFAGFLLLGMFCVIGSVSLSIGRSHDVLERRIERIISVSSLVLCFHLTSAATLILPIQMCVKPSLAKILRF